MPEALQTDLKIDGHKFNIFRSLKVGDTIYSGEVSLTVEDEATLDALKEGNVPEGLKVVAPKKRGRKPAVS